jgi:hypothetical protein
VIRSVCSLFSKLQKSTVSMWPTPLPANSPVGAWT